MHFGPSAVVSPIPAAPDGESGEPAVRVGWTCPSTAVTRGIVANPIYVCPVPVSADTTGAGEYVVSYRQTAVVSTLLDLPEPVSGLMDMVREGRYRPRAPSPEPRPPDLLQETS